MGQDLVVTIGADIKQMQGQLNQANGLVNKFTGSIANAAKGLATAFAIKEIGTAAFDLSLLAARAEGVEKAFYRLPGATLLLREMKKETAGAVSELELMQRAVQFNKFGLNLEELPKLLKFASLTAQETGQDVNYLVDSIVTGLGRKSVLILDNLGLSASRIKEEVDKTGDFVKAVGKIVDEELPKMGTIMDNNATAVKNTNAQWDDLKVNMGKLINESGILQAALGGINNALRELNSDHVDETAELTKEFKKLRQEAAAKGDLNAWAMYNDLVQQGADKLKKYLDVKKQSTTDGTDQKTIRNLELINAEIKTMEELLQRAGSTGEIKRIKDQIETLKSEAVDLEFGKVPARKNVGAFTPSKKTIGFDSPDLKISATAEAMMKLTQAQLANNTATLAGQQAWAQLQEQLSQNLVIADQVGDMFGSYLGDVITKQQSEVQALRNFTADIVQMYGQQAILAAVSKAAQGAPPGPFAIFAAGAAAAAMSRLIRSLGGSSTGGGGGGGATQNISRLGSIATEPAGKRINVNVTGTLRGSGKDLKATLDNYNRTDGRLRG